MKIAVLKESEPGERRVAATPETVKKFVALGASVAVETGAGEAATVSDADYVTAGASVGPRSEVLKEADIILVVQGPGAAGLNGVKPGVLLVGALNPFGKRDQVDAYAAAGVEALAMEFLPRITRAQSMDILSSQANLAGYKAVLDAVAEYGRALPMMMTAAGTISAARLFVMGVGVAGLQAIATGRRLGAVVSATDVRAATKEQIKSLGAKPIFVEAVAGIEGEGAGGYATEMSDEYKKAQAELVSSHIAKQDIVITTALIPGRPAPRLISDDQIATMRAGSVIVDLAVEQGGNVEGAKLGEVVEKHGVRIVGHKNVPSRLAADTSALYARNLYNFLSAFWDGEAKTVTLPDDDEIVKGVRLTHGRQGRQRAAAGVRSMLRSHLVLIGALLITSSGLVPLAEAHGQSRDLSTEWLAEQLPTGVELETSSSTPFLQALLVPTSLIITEGAAKTAAGGELLPAGTRLFRMKTSQIPVYCTVTYSTRWGEIWQIIGVHLCLVDEDLNGTLDTYFDERADRTALPLFGGTYPAERHPLTPLGFAPHPATDFSANPDGTFPPRDHRWSIFLKWTGSAIECFVGIPKWRIFHLPLVGGTRIPARELLPATVNACGTRLRVLSRERGHLRMVVESAYPSTPLDVAVPWQLF